MIVDRAAIRRYSSGIVRLERQAMSVATRSVGKFLDEMDELDVEKVRNYAIKVEDAVADKYGNAAAVLAQQLFADIMSRENVAAEPVLYDGPDHDAIERGVRYQIGKLLLGRRAEFLRELAELASYHVRRAANQTIIVNVERVNGDG